MRSLTESALLLIAARIVAFVFNTAVPIVLVRQFTQQEFGLYKQVFIYLTTVTSLLPMGVGLSAYYFLPRMPERRGAVILNILITLGMLGVVATAIMLAVPSLLPRIFNEPLLAQYNSLLSIVVALWLLGAFLEIVAVAHQDIGAASIYIIGIQFSRTTLFFTAAVFWTSIQALLWAAFAQGLLQTATLLYYLSSRFPGFWRQQDPALFRAQLSYALPFGAAGLLYVLQTDLHNYFVSYHYGTELFAIYAVGCFQLPLIGILSDSVASVLMPRISHLQQQDAKREIFAITARAMRKLAAVFLPLYAFLMVMGPEFIRLVFTSRYDDSWPVFAINLTILPLSVVLFDPVIRAFSEQRFFQLKVQIVTSALLLATLITSIGSLGLAGTIAAVVLVNGLARAVLAYRAYHILHLRRKDLAELGDVVRIAVSAAAAAAAAASLKSLWTLPGPLAYLVACGIVFTTVYGAVLLVFGVPTVEEWALVKNLTARVRRMAVFAWLTGA